MWCLFATKTGTRAGACIAIVKQLGKRVLIFPHSRAVQRAARLTTNTPDFDKTDSNEPSEMP